MSGCDTVCRYGVANNACGCATPLLRCSLCGKDATSPGIRRGENIQFYIFM